MNRRAVFAGCPLQATDQTGPSPKEKRLAMRSEQELLDLLNDFFPPEHERLLLGRGDDAAVVPCSDSLCVSTDVFLEEAHFRRRYFAPGDLGYKALAVNVSDMAAMGAEPLAFALNLLIPQGLDRSFWKECFRAMAGLAGEYDLALAGGDLSRAGLLGFDITIWGRMQERFLQRRCAPGDQLFLVGEIGLARAGLGVLEEGAAPIGFESSVRAHLRPEMRVGAGKAAAACPAVKGLMDVSDGLARDLPRLIGPSRGARLSLRETDLHPEVREYAALSGVSAVEFALLGGEDYALLGSVDRDGLQSLLEHVPQARIIGEVTPEPGIFVNGEPFAAQGFDHFGR
jgi:thiamine-monophosphate kinase